MTIDTFRHKVSGALLTLSLALASLVTPAAFADTETGDSVAPVLWLPAMNVFRRHTAPSEEMFSFYGRVLGLEQLGTFAVGNGGVSRFKAGASELKLTLRVDDREYVEGGIDNATGLRLITLYFPDEVALADSFKNHDLPEPRFIPWVDNTTTTLVQDPDGQWVQLVAAPGKPDSYYQKVDVSLTVSDIEASREFYGNFVGLDALEPTHDPLLDTTKYGYRNGSTTVNLVHYGDNLPRDTGSAGIQYVVSDIQEVDRLVDEHDIVVDQPLSELEGFSLLTIWVDDPDGITNYFAQTGVSGSSQ